MNSITAAPAVNTVSTLKLSKSALSKKCHTVGALWKR